MRERRFLPCILAMFVAGTLEAQQYGLRTFSLDEGLPSASVNALCEDQAGFLWVATDAGAARSAGLRFDVYDRRGGLPVDEVTAP